MSAPGGIARPLLVLLFLATAVVNLIWFAADWNWDKLVIAALFVAVAMDIRTIGIYRRRLGLER